MTVTDITAVLGLVTILTTTIVLTLREELFVDKKVPYQDACPVTVTLLKAGYERSDNDKMPLDGGVSPEPCPVYELWDGAVVHKAVVNATWVNFYTLPVPNLIENMRSVKRANLNAVKREASAHLKLAEEVK